MGINNRVSIQMDVPSQVCPECSPCKIIVGWIERRERTEAECDAAALHGVRACAHVAIALGAAAPCRRSRWNRW